MKNKLLPVLFTALLSVIIITACGATSSNGLSTEDSIATSVAATVNAQPGAPAEPADTAQPALPAHELTTVPTEAPLPPTSASYPLSVAFVTPDKNAYFWSEIMSAPIALTSSGDVENAIVSPDGSQVALTRSSDWVSYTLDVINSDGSNLRTLLSPAGFNALPRPAEAVASVPSQLSWVPGTRTLAMTTRISYEGPGHQTGDSLFLFDTDTLAMRVLFNVGVQWGWQYSFSPDGTRIAVSYPEGMDIYNASGVKLERPVLAYPFINTASEYAWVASPAWSADGTTLVAVVPPQDPWVTPLADSSVYRVYADGTGGELMFDTQMTYWPTQIADISPDLSKLAFLVPTGAAPDGNFTLRLANIDGSGLTDYTTGKIYNVPEWSTDSTRFFYRDDTSGAWIGQAGSAPLSIPDFNYTRDVAWIDANRFIGASGPEGGWKLLLGTIGSPTGVIYSAAGGDERLHFTVNR